MFSVEYLLCSTRLKTTKEYNFLVKKTWKENEKNTWYIHALNGNGRPLQFLFVHKMQSDTLRPSHAKMDTWVSRTLQIRIEYAQKMKIEKGTNEMLMLPVPVWVYTYAVITRPGTRARTTWLSWQTRKTTQFLLRVVFVLSIRTSHRIKDHRQRSIASYVFVSLSSFFVRAAFLWRSYCFRLTFLRSHRIQRMK